MTDFKTDTGRKLLSKVYCEEKSVGERMIQGLNKEELANFQRITQIMTDNLIN